MYNHRATTEAEAGKQGVWLLPSKAFTMHLLVGPCSSSEYGPSFPSSLAFSSPSLPSPSPLCHHVTNGVEGHGSFHRNLEIPSKALSWFGHQVAAWLLQIVLR